MTTVRWWAGAVRNLLAVLGLTVVLVTATPVTSAWTRWLTGNRWDSAEGDTLIVLSAEPPLRPGELMGYSSYWRCVGAVNAWRKGQFRRVVVTGSSGSAASMAEYLTAHGVPPDIILREDAAKSTAENASFTANLLPPDKRGRVALLSSDYHMRRAVAVFEKAGFERLVVIPQADAGKRLLNPLQRWQVAVDLGTETAKLMWYAVSGLI